MIPIGKAIAEAIALKNGKGLVTAFVMASEADLIHVRGSPLLAALFESRCVFQDPGVDIIADRSPDRHTFFGKLLSQETSFAVGIPDQVGDQLFDNGCSIAFADVRGEGDDK